MIIGETGGRNQWGEFPMAKTKTRQRTAGEPGLVPVLNGRFVLNVAAGRQSD